MNKGVLSIVLTAGLLATSVEASELVYRPRNPNFGGNPLNGAFLLGTAQAQNDFQDKSLSSFGRPTTGQDFADRITSALISRVALEIGNQILGENAQNQGEFQLDGTSIRFERVGNQVVINIIDTATGGSTTIEIPAPVF